METQLIITNKCIDADLVEELLLAMQHKIQESELANGCKEIYLPN